MCPARYFGDDRLRYRVENRSDRYTECIYCSNGSNTREHVPSKVLLTKPYPDNLPTLPACFECNNSYSSKELMVSLLIQIMKKSLYGDNYTFPQGIEERIQKNEGLLKKINSIVELGDYSELESDIEEVLIKLARGHSVWDISTGFYVKKEAENIRDIKVNYKFIHEMLDGELKEFSSIYVVTNFPLPEIGGRLFDSRLLVYQDVENNINELVVLWEEVQSGGYEYICYQFGDLIEVKIIIGNFLFATVQFNEAEMKKADNQIVTT